MKQNVVAFLAGIVLSNVVASTFYVGLSAFTFLLGIGLGFLLKVYL